MADFKIICTDQEPVTEPTTHAHIVAVGIDTDNNGSADERHTKATVISNIKSRLHRYYTVGLRSGMRAFVEVVFCSLCNEEIIRSTPDSTVDNNLDFLRRCNWKS